MEKFETFLEIFEAIQIFQGQKQNGRWFVRTDWSCPSMKCPTAASASGATRTSCKTNGVKMKQAGEIDKSAIFAKKKSIV